MNKRPPKWKRNGYQNENEYRAACKSTKQIEVKALRATGATHGAQQVLRYLWNRAEFDRPEVTTTKQQICEDTSLSRRTVQVAVRFLKKEGSIAPIRGVYGGKGVPITFALKIARATEDLHQRAVEDMNEKRQREIAFKYLASKHGALEAMRILETKRGDI